jgi:putative signal transducing protein
LREIIRTNDPVLISVIQHLLKQAEVYHMVLDTNMSVMEGSLGILPCRILVEDDGWDEARQTLTDADIELEPDKYEDR